MRRLVGALLAAAALATVGCYATLRPTGEGAGQHHDRAEPRRGEHERDGDRNRDHEHARDRDDRHPDRP